MYLHCLEPAQIHLIYMNMVKLCTNVWDWNKFVYQWLIQFINLVIVYFKHIQFISTIYRNQTCFILVYDWHICITSSLLVYLKLQILCAIQISNDLNVNLVLCIWQFENYWLICVFLRCFRRNVYCKETYESYYVSWTMNEHQLSNESFLVEVRSGK